MRKFCCCSLSKQCPTLCDSMDYIDHGIFQARIQEWVAFPFFRSPSLLGSFPTQGSNPGLLYCRWILYHLSHQGSSAAAAKWLQSCLTLCDPIDGSPPGSTIPRILQARTLEWVAISFSREALSTSYQRSISRTSGLRCRLSISIYSFFQTLY